MGAGTKQHQTAIGAGAFDFAADQGGGVVDLGGNGAFAGARGPDQKYAARLFQIDPGRGQALGQGEGERRIGTDFGKICRFAHQGMAQAFGQAVALHGRAQQMTQIGARESDQIVVGLGEGVGHPLDLTKRAQPHRGMDLVLAHHHRLGTETLDDRTHKGPYLR
jgi:hypothetical protein